MAPLLSIRDAAQRLDLSRWTVRRMVKSGELPASVFGGPKRVEYKIEAADVERLIAARRLVVQRPKGRRAGGEKIPTYV